MRVYLEHLLSALLRVAPNEEFLLFYHTRRSWSRSAPEVLSRFTAPNARLVAAPGVIRALPDSAWWWGYYPPLKHLLREPVDVFHGGEFLFPFSNSTPLIGTIYDLTPELFPTLHLWPNRLRHGRQMQWFARHARRAIAISASTARDFHSGFGDRLPIDVVYPGVVATAAECASDTGRSETMDRLRAYIGHNGSRYILCVGTVEPRKNGARLIQAFERVCTEEGAQTGDIHLVFAGRRGWRSDTIYAAASGSAIADRIHFTGPVSPSELSALYGGAFIFAYPSLYEGFGLPVLEAMQAGIPVLTSNTSSLPEVAGNAAVLIDPEDVGSLTAGLQRLLWDSRLRENLARKGTAHAAHFSWDRAASLTLETYRRAIGGREK